MLPLLKSLQAELNPAGKKRSLLLRICVVFLPLLLFGFSPPQDENPRFFLQDPMAIFGAGEHVDYRVHYGWITAGEASMKVAPRLQMHGSRVCFGMEVVGKTTGAFDKVLRIRDTWGTLFDTASNMPQKSYRMVEEGKYRREEEVFFDQSNQNAHVETKDKDDKDFKIPTGVQDIVSGFYYLRLVDYSRLKVGDILKMDAFNDGELFKFNVVYRGKDKIKTSFGKANVIVLSPIMPKNSLFDGENSIKFYISDDKNKIPLKIRAEMFVGAVELDIKGYGNLRAPINFN
ncbi:MAG: DUF3108 domain-containing protein [Bacteroidota bacterium]